MLISVIGGMASSSRCSSWYGTPEGETSGTTQRPISTPTCASRALKYVNPGNSAAVRRICNAAAALLFAADAVVVDAVAAAAARGRTGARRGRPPRVWGRTRSFRRSEMCCLMYRMRRSSTFGRCAVGVCTFLAGRAGCGAQAQEFNPCRHCKFHEKPLKNERDLKISESLRNAQIFNHA